jgi:hypothetical protein
MKTALTITVFFLFSFTSYSQILGIDYSKAKPISEGSNEELLYQTVGGRKTLMINYATTPVGLKHCIEKAKEIVELNGLNFDKPNVKKNELISALVDGIYDYEMLSLTLSQGSSEVTRMWKMASNDGFVLSLTEKIYCIMILPVPK